MILLAGCTHLGMVDGAIPLEKGQKSFAAAVAYARAPDVIGTSTGAPLPSIGAHYRAGIGQDTDLGLHVYTLGIGADLRYRFAEVAGFHFALQPSLSGLVLPVDPLYYGAIDVGMPLRIERPLGKFFSVTVSPGAIARQTFISATTEEFTTASSTFELYAGGGARVQFAFRRVHFGLSGNLYADTQRATGLYGGVALDFGIRGRSRASSGMAALEIDTVLP